MKRLHEVNYSSGPLVLLNSTSYDENTVAEGAEATTDPVSAGSTGVRTVTSKITTNGVVKRTTIRLSRAVDVSDGETRDALDAANCAISEIVLSGSGRELLKFRGNELLYLHKGLQERNGVVENVYVIDYTVGKLPSGGKFSYESFGICTYVV